MSGVTTTQGKIQLAMNPLLPLRGRGGAIWLDFLSRRFIADRSLGKPVERDGLTGVTSNLSTAKLYLGGLHACRQVALCVA
jgi:hypothetical protein